MNRIHIDQGVISHWTNAVNALDCSSLNQISTIKLNPNNEVLDLASFVDWLEQLGKAGPTNLAWNTGLNYNFRERGIVGQVILESQSVGGALKKICEYFPLIQDNSILNLSVNDGLATLSYKILDPEIWPRHQDAMYSLGVYAGFLTRSVPDLWANLDIMFEAPLSAATSLVSDKLRNRCLYNQSTNVISFPASVLEKPLLNPSKTPPSAISYLTKCLVTKNRSMTMGARVRQLILESLETGPVRQEDIAKKIGMTSRTLRRRLTAEGLSFQHLLDECRMQIVTFEFRTKKIISLTETALKLGYSEHSTFSRAFARWAGLSPQDYRKAIHMGVPIGELQAP